MDSSGFALSYARQVRLRSKLRPTGPTSLFELRRDKKDWANFAMLFTLPSSPKGYAGQDGKAGGLQILRCQGFAVVHYNFTLSACRNEVEIPSPGVSEALQLLQR